jgi:hypothetical protein
MFLISFVMNKQTDGIIEATGVNANKEYSTNEGIILTCNRWRSTRELKLAENTCGFHIVCHGIIIQSQGTRDCVSETASSGRPHTGMRQDKMSATWCKERSTGETNEVMKTAAHRSESWCWRQLHAADTCNKTLHVPFLCVKTQTSGFKEQHQCTLSTWAKSKSWIRFLSLLLRNLSHMYIKISSSLHDVINWRRCEKTQTRVASVCGLESESRMKLDCVFCLMSWFLSWRSWCAAALMYVCMYV